MEFLEEAALSRSWADAGEGHAERLGLIRRRFLVRQFPGAAVSTFPVWESPKANCRLLDREAHDECMRILAQSRRLSTRMRISLFEGAGHHPPPLPNSL